MVTHTETQRYKLETTRNGLFAVLTRKGDGASVHFQDEAASDIVAYADDFANLPESRREELTDHAFSLYDDIMQGGRSQVY